MGQRYEIIHNSSFTMPLFFTTDVNFSLFTLHFSLFYCIFAGDKTKNLIFLDL